MKNKSKTKLRRFFLDKVPLTRKKIYECGKKSKYYKITDVHDTPCDTISGMGTDWIVKCTCPKCGTKFSLSDSDY